MDFLRLAQIMQNGERIDTIRESSIPGPVIPTAMANYVTCNWIPGAVNKVILTLTAVPITITDALAYASVKLLTLQQGHVTLLGGVAKNLVFTTTSLDTSTLNDAKTVQFGVGSAAASATTLATTMLSFMPGTGQSVPTYTSAAQNTASTAVDSALLASVFLDGSGTALPVYLNLAVGTGGDIDDLDHLRLQRQRLNVPP
jgi:hypothetical protein